MSADNGIYILVTPTLKNNPEMYQYRVAECKSIGCIDSFLTTRYMGPSLMPMTNNEAAEHVVSMFGNAKVYYNMEKASEFAKRLLSNRTNVEYGICIIHSINEFPSGTILKLLEDAIEDAECLEEEKVLDEMFTDVAEALPKEDATYYCVWREGIGKPSMLHDTLPEAEAEAERLASGSVGHNFFIMKAIKVVKAEQPKPVIRKFDVIRRDI